MIARVARFEDVNLAEVERTMAEAEALIVPMIEGLAGYEGHLELVSMNGEFLSIALFDSDENAAAAEPVFEDEMPAVLGHLFESWDGHRIGVDHYIVVGSSIMQNARS